jgi:hypothetical protein
MRTGLTFVFYISGHGFGHASRDIEIIDTLAALSPDTRVIVRTSAPRWLFDHSAREPLEVQLLEADTGVVQIDSLNLDEEETARRASAFYRDFGRRAVQEAAWLARHHAALVLGDIPPLAFAAADRAGISSIAIGNFTWDWIYAAYPAFERLAPEVIPAIRNAYGRATRALRLPLHGGFDAMTGVVRDIPFVARRSDRTRDDTRRALGISPDRPAVLVSFGGHDLRLPLEAVARTGSLTVVVTGHTAGAGADALVRVSSDDLNVHRLRYEDLVAAVDVVLSKPGYGIVSECVANGTALLYTSRGRFAEYDVFVGEMPRVLRCRYLPQEDLYSGRWPTAVETLLGQQAPHERPRIDGARVAAEEILELSNAPHTRHAG